MLKVFSMGTLGKLATPIGGHVLTDQFFFSYLCRGLPMDHSCEVGLKLPQWHRRSWRLKEIVDDGY